MSKPMSTQGQAAAELAYRTPAKADRGKRPEGITSEVIALGGAALRELAGPLASAEPTAVEVRAASNNAKALVREARANTATPRPVNALEAAVTRGQTSTRTVNRTSEKATWTFVRDALIAGGYSCPNVIRNAARKGFLAPKA